MKKYLIPKILIIIVIIIAAVLIGQVFLPRKATSEQTIFSVNKGEGSREIGLRLEKEKFIWWSPVFRLYVLTTGVSKNLQAGSYLLSPSMAIPEIAKKFAQGETIKRKVTIPEGFTLRKIEETLNLDLRIKARELENEYFFLEGVPEEANLEGFLFPDTYEIPYGAETKEVVSQFLDNFDKKITPDLREEIKKQGKTLFEIITMASLIEKEVNTEEDRELVSGIFWKRLSARMPLESCATIAYVLNIDKWRYSFEDTRIASPYNTYINQGLPWGPISNPGLESILAAVYPKSSNYWFYLSTPEGETIFSKTLEEHNAAKLKYLKNNE